MHNDINLKKLSTRARLKACIGTFSYCLGIINFVFAFVFAVSSSLVIVYARNFKTFSIPFEMISIPFLVPLVSNILFGLSVLSNSFGNTFHEDYIKFKKTIIIHCIATAIHVLYFLIFCLAFERGWIPVEMFKCGL